MICSTMRVETDRNGRKHLGGTLSYDLRRGTILILKKVNDNEYSLVAIDERNGDRSPASINSFLPPD